MFKKLTTAFLFAIASSGSFAQTTVTFVVNITAFLDGGGVFVNNQASIAGNFTSRGATLPNWDPGSGLMTDLGGNLYSKTIIFNGPTISTDSLEWKYVQGTEWTDGDEGNDWYNSKPDCKKPSSGYNRKILLPASGNLVISANWGECPQVLSDVASIVEKTSFHAFPNPTAGNLNIQIQNQTEAVNLKVVSFDGKTVVSKENLNPDIEAITLDVANLPNGVYKLVVSGKTWFNQKTISIMK